MLRLQSTGLATTIKWRQAGRLAIIGLHMTSVLLYILSARAAGFLAMTLVPGQGME